MKRAGDIDLSIVLRDKRFLGLRVGIIGFLVGAIGFILALSGYGHIGMCLFMGAWLIIFIGFLMHISKWGSSKKS